MSAISDTLDKVFTAIITRHFSSQPTSRAAMVLAGNCSQPEWNLANDLLQKIGLREGKKFKFPNGPAETWAQISDRVEVKSGKILYKPFSETEPEGWAVYDPKTAEPLEESPSA